MEVATALPLLSDAAFKLYIFLCLHVDRHSARMVWEPMELARLLQRDRESVTVALRGTLRPGKSASGTLAAAGRFANDRISVEICDRYWPYEKPPVEEFGIDQDRYVQQVRQMLLAARLRARQLQRAPTSDWRPICYRRGVTLVHLQRAIWLGCARKYAALLNGERTALPGSSAACTTSPSWSKRSLERRWEKTTGSTSSTK